MRALPCITFFLVLSFGTMPEAITFDESDFTDAATFGVSLDTSDVNNVKALQGAVNLGEPSL